MLFAARRLRAAHAVARRRLAAADARLDAVQEKWTHAESLLEQRTQARVKARCNQRGNIGA